MADSPKGARSAVRLAPMEVPKASDVLAEELRERILSGEFVEDTQLPPERDLVTQTQMSRSTVREALRILEVQGLVRIKSGRAGGAFVQRPSQDSVATSLSLLIRGRQLRLADLLQTREAIEPVCASLAAQNRTDEELAALHDANKALEAAEGNLSDFLDANIDWHIGVATAGHNELLEALMIALSKAIYTATENEAFVDADVRKVTARAHKSITTAIRQQNPEAAVRRMNRHVHSYAKAVLETDERVEIPVDD